MGPIAGAAKALNAQNDIKAPSLSGVKASCRLAPAVAKNGAPMRPVKNLIMQKV
jgi:hypothetical protein